jgi:hypothetical protein
MATYGSKARRRKENAIAAYKHYSTTAILANNISEKSKEEQNGKTIESKTTHTYTKGKE